MEEMSLTTIYEEINYHTFEEWTNGTALANPEAAGVTPFDYPAGA